MLEFAFSTPSLFPDDSGFSNDVEDSGEYRSGTLFSQFLEAKAQKPVSSVRPVSEGNPPHVEAPNDEPDAAKFAEFDKLRYPFNEGLKTRWQQHKATMEHLVRYRRSAAFGTRGSSEDIAFFTKEEKQITTTLKRQRVGISAARSDAARLLREPNGYEVRQDFKTYTDAMHDLMAVEIEAIEKCLALVQLLLLAWNRPGRDGKFLHVHALRLSELVDDILTDDDIQRTFNDGDGDEVGFEQALEESFADFRMVRAELAK